MDHIINLEFCLRFFLVKYNRRSFIHLQEVHRQVIHHLHRIIFLLIIKLILILLIPVFVVSLILSLRFVPFLINVEWKMLLLIYKNYVDFNISLPIINQQFILLIQNK
jgi:hypothetical protein